MGTGVNGGAFWSRPSARIAHHDQIARYLVNSGQLLNTVRANAQYVYILFFN